jgi:protein SCO1
MLLLALGISACAPARPPFALHDVTGLLPRLDLALTDQDGELVTGKSYRGEIVLLYFGYTHCPDACPTTLATLVQALHLMGSSSREVRVLFVTVDPARDSQAVLKRYVGFFGSSFVGLHGDDAELTALSKRYRITYHRDLPDRSGNYAVGHSNAVFVFDRHGRARLLATSADGPAAIARDLRHLLGSG